MDQWGLSGNDNNPEKSVLSRDSCDENSKELPGRKGIRSPLPHHAYKERKRTLEFIQEGISFEQDKFVAGDSERTDSKRSKSIIEVDETICQRFAEHKQRFSQEFETCLKSINFKSSANQSFSERDASKDVRFSPVEVEPKSTVSLRVPDTDPPHSLEQGLLTNKTNSTCAILPDNVMQPSNYRAMRSSFPLPPSPANFRIANVAYRIAPIDDLSFTTRKTSLDPSHQNFDKKLSKFPDEQQPSQQNNDPGVEPKTFPPAPSSLVRALRSRPKSMILPDEFRISEPNDHFIARPLMTPTERLLASSSQQIWIQPEKEKIQEEFKTFIFGGNDKGAALATPILGQNTSQKSSPEPCKTTARSPLQHTSSEDSNLKLLATRLGPNGVDFVIDTFFN